MDKSKFSTHLLVLFLSSLLLSGCGISQLSRNNGVDDWIKQRSDLAEKQRVQDEVNAASRAEKIKNDRDAYERANPEIAVTGLGDVITAEKASALRSAFNSMPFVTRIPNTTDPKQVYAKIGEYKLTLYQIEISIKEQMTECRRISAYSGQDFDAPCFNQVGKGLSNFSSIIKNKSIPDLTKKAALGEATFGRIIDFDHAARLAKMHQGMCSQKNNIGYAAMITVAVPCSGSGDVLSMSVAERTGLL
ncbi:hypothetical protein [Serratia fonticola]|uniref:hypothetical protein n=1 Tax=Serratia fonticola TaxID=47917 RepID=UPI00217890A4|nr:hypothetical protein [Serratia fonticola]CAI1594371.1 Uncharacterised protein [Serratia fonticola]CAI1904651.1 Uncharacterised protein [Serratia fonticola]CAI1927269.1 Uncharacterised protein [Serratia fonticola]